MNEYSVMRNKVNCEMYISYKNQSRLQDNSNYVHIVKHTVKPVMKDKTAI